MHMTATRHQSLTATIIQESASITTKYTSLGATDASTFYQESEIVALDPKECPGFKRTVVKVVDGDTLEAARDMIREDADGVGGDDGGDDEGKGKGKGDRIDIMRRTAVLNLASDIIPGGGWKDLISETQEEALCYSSTLYATLSPSYYPWRNTGPGSASGIFSPGVTVYRDTLANQCELLPETSVVVLGVITVAAPRGPRLTADRTEIADPGVAEDLARKVRAIYRVAAMNGRSRLVMGALGCGAYRCPQNQVARVMKEVLLEEEFRGWFERVWWAVKDPLGEGNLGAFGEALDGVVVG